MKDQTRGSSRSRRQHERAFKDELIAQSLVPGASVAAIAMKGGINANLLFKWRREHVKAMAASAPTAATLLPVCVIAEAASPSTVQPTAPRRPCHQPKLASRRHRSRDRRRPVAASRRRRRDHAEQCLARAAPQRMIGPRAGTRVWLAAGVTDMRCGIDSLAAKVQMALTRGSVQRPRLRVPRPQRRPGEVAVERWRRHVPVDEAA